jgi:hypothetical protein
MQMYLGVKKIGNFDWGVLVNTVDHNETSGSVKGGEFLYQLSDWNFLKKNSFLR